MSGLIQRLPGVNFTDTSLPIVGRDSIINGGSLYVFDFLDPACNPHANGSLASGTSFTNLVTGGAAGSVVGTGLTKASNGIVLPGVDGVGVDFGATHSRDDDHPFMTGLWCEVDASLNVGYPVILSLANNTSTLEYAFDGGISPGKGLRVIGPGGGLITSGVPAPTSRVQVVFMWEPGVLRAYAGGALIGTTTSGVPSTVTYPTGRSEGIGRRASSPAIAAGYPTAPWKGRVLRCWKEDLHVSCAESGLSYAAQALAQVQRDWADNNARLT